MKATAEQLDAWSGQYDETTVPGSIVLPAARWWDVQSALRQLADLRRQSGTAKEIVANVCAQHENPRLAATSPFILAAFDEVLASLKREPVAAPPAPKVEAPKPAPAAVPEKEKELSKSNV